jgi:hypothetical protein
MNYIYILVVPLTFKELYTLVAPLTFKELYKLAAPLTFNLDNVFILSAILSFASIACNPVEDNNNNPF